MTARGAGRKPWRHLLPALATGCLWQCTDQLAGGTTDVGNAGVVLGEVQSLDGTAAGYARVMLLPATFDPGSRDSLPAAYSVHADKAGQYRIPDAVPGAYNLEIHDSSEQTSALITDIRISGTADKQPLRQSLAKLVEPGSISFSLDGEPLEGYCYLPGTTVFSAIDSAAKVTGKLTLSKVPAGRYPEMIHAVPGTSARNLLGLPVEVKAGTDLNLGPYHAWSSVRRIALDAGVSGLTQPTAFLGFPLLVRLNAGNFDFSGAKSKGEDIRIAKSDGATPLPFEIENWDALNQQAEIWIGVDTLFAGNPGQSFLLYSGNANAAAKADSGTVFDTAAGFVGVWHMGFSLKDATGFGNHGLDSGASPVAGLIGLARQFDGIGGRVAVQDQSSLQFGSGDLTLSAWILADSVDTTRQVFSKRDAAGDYEIQVRGSGQVQATLTIGCCQGISLYSKTLLRKGTWYNLVLSRAAGKASFYLNGILEAGPTDVLVAISPKSELWIGDDPLLPGQEVFNGKIDEVEFSRQARSADWINLIFETQKPGAQAVHVIPEK